MTLWLQYNSTHQKHKEEYDSPENREWQLQNKIRIGQEDKSCVSNEKTSLLRPIRVGILVT